MIDSVTATTEAQRVVADGPHRIETTATPMQQQMVLLGATAIGFVVTLGKTPRRATPQSTKPVQLNPELVTR